MKYWKELPYRGDGESRNKKPRRRFRKMKLERRETVVSIFIILVFGLIFFACITFSPGPDDNGAAKLGGIVVVALFILTLIAGILSANKFRKGYDVDISDEAEKEKQSEDSNDL